MPDTSEELKIRIGIPVILLVMCLGASVLFIPLSQGFLGANNWELRSVGIWALATAFLLLLLIKPFFSIRLTRDKFYVKGFGRWLNWNNFVIPFSELHEVYLGRRERFPLNLADSTGTDLHVLTKTEHFFVGCNSISEKDVEKMKAVLERRGVAFHDRRSEIK